MTVHNGKAWPSPTSGGRELGCSGLSRAAATNQCKCPRQAAEAQTPWADGGGSSYYTVHTRSCTRRVEGSYPSALNLVRGGGEALFK